MTITVRLPRIAAGLLSNLVGLFGLVAVAIAVGGLTGNWWWTALVGGVFSVGLAALAQVAAAEARPAQPATAGKPLAAVGKAS